jgi:hypothetical protein
MYTHRRLWRQRWIESQNVCYKYPAWVFLDFSWAFSPSFTGYRLVCHQPSFGWITNDCLGTVFITCQDQSRFCEKPSENHFQDNKVVKTHTKTRDDWIIYWCNIFETNFRLIRTFLPKFAVVKRAGHFSCGCQLAAKCAHADRRF